MTTILLLILAGVFIAALPIIGYILGQRAANEAIMRERELIVNLQAQNDGLQSRMLSLLDETIKGGTNHA